MTFRVRITLVVLALTALTMGGAFAAVWERFVAAQRQQLDDALLVVARREAAEAAGGQLEFTDAPGPSANAVGPLPKYGVVYTAGGRAVSTTPNLTVDTAPPMPRLVPFDTGFDFDQGDLRLRAVMVGVPGGRTLRVLLASPRADFEEDARLLGHAMLVAFLVGCVWAALIGFGVASRLTREHRIVASVARTVASGDTSARVQFKSSDADLRQLAKDLNAMIERLVGLLAMQDRFISHAAHELRTPLASLRIELEHALQTASAAADYDAALRGALDSSRRLTDLAEDLLQLARTRSAITDEVVVLEDALADAIADVAPVGRCRGVAIVTEPVSAIVRGDRRGVARLFRNVVENAVRFAPRDTSVRVEVRAEEERVVVVVIDAGPGIKPEDEEKIFEPFVRGARADGEGTGLGLSIARGLARAFGGDVTVERASGGRFVIELPRWRRSADGRDSTSQGSRPEMTTKSA
jgi:two-component system, OmpR family, sensor kinase